MVILLVLLGSARLLLKSDWLFDSLQPLLIQQVEKQIQGSLQIESIRGDLLSEFEIRNLSLSDSDGYRIITADTIRIHYRITELLRSPYTIRSVLFDGIELHLSESETTGWNVVSLYQADPNPDTTAEPLHWTVEELHLRRSAMHAESQNLPDGQLSTTRIEASLSAGHRPDGFFVTLHSLEMDIEQERLPKTAGFLMKGEIDGNRFSLDRLVLETSHSLFTAAASALLPHSVEAEVRLDPLSRSDLSLYLDQLPLQQDLNISLGISGSINQLNLDLQVNAPGIRAARATAKLDASANPLLTDLTVQIDEINLHALTGIEHAPSIGSAIFSGAGSLPLSNPLDGYGQFTGEMLDIHSADIRLDRISSETSLENKKIALHMNLFKGDEQMALNASADFQSLEQPSWNAALRSDSFQAADWFDNPALNSDLCFTALFNGEGFSLNSFMAEIDILFQDSRIGTETFSEIRFTGSVDPETIQGFLFAKLDQSRFEMDLSAEAWQDHPDYRFLVSADNFNLSELSYFDQFPTQLQGRLEGTGSGLEPESLRLDALLSFDKSIINGETVDAFSAGLTVSNGFLSAENGILNSPIARAQFSFVQHLNDFTHPANQLSFHSELADLSALAPAAGLRLLQANGTISGRSARNADGVPEFEGEMLLTDIQADTLLSAAMLTARWSVLLREEPEAEIHLSITEPEIQTIRLNNIVLNSHFTAEKESVTGHYYLRAEGESGQKAEQRAVFSLGRTESRLTTTQLDFASPQRQLVLRNPFTFYSSGGSFRMDTLTVSSENEQAFLSLWIDGADSLNQQAGLEAENIRVEELQSAIMKEPLVRGLLTGKAEISNTAESKWARSSVQLNEIGIHDGRMDSLKVDLLMSDEGFEAGFKSWHHNTLLIDSAMQIPWLPSTKAANDGIDMDAEVNGFFRINPSRLEYWLSLLPAGWRTDASGLLAAEFLLSGSAGLPALDGDISLSAARFSGIGLDRLSASISYQHQEAEVTVRGSAVKEGQQIADLDGRIPLLIDLPEGSWNLPGDDDFVEASLRTNGFELSLLNSYLDQDFFRQLSGTVDGNLRLSGKLSQLRPEGELTLRNGTLRVVPAAITLRQIRSQIIFEPELISVREFSANSGPGSLRGTGQLELNGFTPGNIHAELTGRQFRLMNTPQVNAIVNSNLTLSGTLFEPQLQGSVNFLSGFYFLQDFGETTVEEVVLEDEAEAELYSIDFYDLLEMELAVRFNRQFFVRNRQYLDMEIELEGELDILKNRHEELQLFGSLEGVRGYLRPLGRLFTLNEAVLSFYGPAEDPQLQIRTSYEPPQAADITIYYVIDGTLQDPEFRFESEPYLPPRDMISYTLFGRPFYELDSWKQVVTGPGSGPSPSGIAIDLVLDRVEMLASQNLGIDVVQIDNTRSGSSNTTTIKTGWYLNRRTFFAILNEVGGSRPKTLFMIEYLLRDNLELILTQGDDSREGIDLRWKLDY